MADKQKCPKCNTDCNRIDLGDDPKGRKQYMCNSCERSFFRKKNCEN